jgi:glucose-1-phosphate adenylyltransferase
MVAGGCIISGGTVRESILFRRVRVNSYSSVERSVLFDEVDIGRHAQVKNAIIDKDVRVPPNTKIGFDLAADKARGFTVTDNGIVVVPKGYKFD